MVPSFQRAMVRPPMRIPITTVTITAPSILFNFSNVKRDVKKGKDYSSFPKRERRISNRLIKIS